MKELENAYCFLRILENRLQERNDEQVHELPADPDARERLAYAMDCANWKTLLERLNFIAAASRVTSVRPCSGPCPSRRMLMLAAAPVVADLLAAGGKLKILATSRAPLRLRGERGAPVLPLPLPDLASLPLLEQLAEVEAVALFVQRAQEVRPDFWAYSGQRTGSDGDLRPAGRATTGD